VGWMMSRVEFIYYGIPTGKGRARVSTRGGFARAYTPKKTQEAEQSLQAQAAQYRPEKLMSNPVFVFMNIYVPIPKSFPKKKRELALKGWLRPPTKPDGDNIEKLTSDAFNGLFWEDDKQVVDMIRRKWYSDIPRIHFEIIEIEEGQTPVISFRFEAIND